MAAIAIVMVLFCALAVTLASLYLRHRNQQMFHQERMAALEKGATIPVAPGPASWTSRVYLLRGLIWTMTGLALVVCLYGISLAIETEHHTSAETKAYQAQNIARNLDVPIDQARQIVEKDAAQRNSGSPMAVSMLGLIPLAVGLAYLVFYFTEPSRKRGANQLS
jgi:hypothetical protein